MSGVSKKVCCPKRRVRPSRAELSGGVPGGVAVRLDPVEAPFERPHQPVFGDGGSRRSHAWKNPAITPSILVQMHFVLRLLINAAALWVAIQIVGGFVHRGTGASLLLVALVFGVLNASVRPLLKLFTFPLLILTLGLFTFVINALMLMLTAGCQDCSTSAFTSPGSGLRLSADSSSASSASCCRCSREWGRRRCTWRHDRFAAERDLQQVWRVLPPSDDLKPAR